MKLRPFEEGKKAQLMRPTATLCHDQMCRRLWRVPEVLCACVADLPLEGNAPRQRLLLAAQQVGQAGHRWGQRGGVLSLDLTGLSCDTFLCLDR